MNEKKSLFFLLIYPKKLESILYVCIIGHMEITHAITSFAALSQETRLKAFRLLVSHEPEGLPAGEVARQLSVPHNTMSTHLAVLARAGWVTSERQSRQIIYRASLSHMQTVIEFLLQDCCAGHPELCVSLLDNLSGCATDSNNAINMLDNNFNNQPHG